MSIYWKYLQRLMLVQTFKQNWQPIPSKISGYSVPEKNGEKLVHNENSYCSKCEDPLIQDSFCTECKGAIDLACMRCGTKSTYDTHDFCYCQLEVLVPRQRYLTKILDKYSELKY